jgi:hypothetical protein
MLAHMGVELLLKQNITSRNNTPESLSTAAAKSALSKSKGTCMKRTRKKAAKPLVYGFYCHP